MPDEDEDLLIEANKIIGSYYGDIVIYQIIFIFTAGIITEWHIGQNQR